MNNIQNIKKSVYNVILKINKWYIVNVDNINMIIKNINVVIYVINND